MSGPEFVPVFGADRELTEVSVSGRADGDVTAINVVLQYPGKGLMEVPEAVEEARALKASSFFFNLSISRCKWRVMAFSSKT